MKKIRFQLKTNKSASKLRNEQVIPADAGTGPMGAMCCRFSSGGVLTISGPPEKQTLWALSGTQAFPSSLAFYICYTQPPYQFCKLLNSFNNSVLLKLPRTDGVCNSILLRYAFSLPFLRVSGAV